MHFLNVWRKFTQYYPIPKISTKNLSILDILDNLEDLEVLENLERQVEDLPMCLTHCAARCGAAGGTV